MKWEHQYSQADAKVTMELNKDATVTEVLDDFARFLIICGYHADSIKRSFKEYVAKIEDEDVAF